jgi:hypothetical protein
MWFYLNKFLGSTLDILILLLILASCYKMLSWGFSIYYRLLYFLVKSEHFSVFEKQDTFWKIVYVEGVRPRRRMILLNNMHCFSKYECRGDLSKVDDLSFV